MKTGNIGIKNIADIGVAGIDPYGTDNKKYAAFTSSEKVKLRIGVFFDGTGNNKFNSDDIYYNSKYNPNYKPKPYNHPLQEDKVPEIKGFKSFIIESGSSYWNSYSNVALLFDLYEVNQTDKTEKNPFYHIQQKYYIEGIGTLQHKEDTTIMGYVGSGMGEGERGVIRRVEEACQKIADGIDTALKNIQNKKTDKPLEIISIQFDVFGFSRGAAAARHFCNEVLNTRREEIKDRFGKRNNRTVRQNNTKNVKVSTFKAELIQSKADATKKEKDNLEILRQYAVLPASTIFTGGILGKKLKQKKIKFPKHQVSIEFLGIFDTVISQMLERKGIIDKARNPITAIKTATIYPFSGLLTNKVALIKKVNPNLSNPNIKRVLHLKAQTEWRDNFPVTPVGEFHGICSREISVLGAHSDIGGAYWQTEKEIHTLHFFNIGVDTPAAEKQKLEQQKNILRNWYISQKLCNANQLYWEVMHEIHSFEGLGGDGDAEKNELLPESFMGNATQKTIGNWTYILKGYRHKLLSRRSLNNKLSLVYMNVMKYIALNYAEVPFTFPVDDTPHPEEYKYPEDFTIKDDQVYELKNENATKPQNGKKTDLEKYQNLIIKIAEHGWINKEGKEITYPSLINKDFKYPVYSDMYKYIMNKFVHLSANFDSPLLEMLEDYNFAYANVPHFKDEKEFKDPPYERQSYSPELAVYDTLP
nr:DUF2235 domain-containing protein [uncultured Chryseobacterium sp.]